MTHTCTLNKKASNEHTMTYTYTEQRRRCETMTKPTSQPLKHTHSRTHAQVNTTTTKSRWQILHESSLSVCLENYTYTGSIEHQFVVSAKQSQSRIQCTKHIRIHKHRRQTHMNRVKLTDHHSLQYAPYTQINLNKCTHMHTPRAIESERYIHIGSTQKKKTFFKMAYIAC